MRGAQRALAFALVGAGACGTPPPARTQPVAPPIVSAAPARDPCEPVDGKPPAPVTGSYGGVLAAARCQAEVLSIMQGLTRALGVDCPYCHVATDFAAPTRQKQVANWMATELVPKLGKRAGGAITCADCHADGGRPRAKILGDPRSKRLAVEWMTTRLVERFDTAGGQPLYCKTCHVENLGSPGFRAHLILGELMPGAAP